MAARVPRLAPRWLKEVTAQSDWERFQAADFQRLKQDFGVTWVVLSRPDRTLAEQTEASQVMTCPYRTSSFKCAVYTKKVASASRRLSRGRVAQRTQRQARTNANRFFPKTRSTLRPDGGYCARRPPRRHSVHLPRVDGSLRPDALGLRPDRALHRLRPRLRQSVSRNRIVCSFAACLLLPACRHFQNLRN